MAKSKLAPNFLLPILQEVVLAGKSVEMLQSLGRLKSVHDGKLSPVFLRPVELDLITDDMK